VGRRAGTWLSDARHAERVGAELAGVARGLLQVLPATGASLKLDVNEPATNVLAGARYLRILLDRYNRTDLALAAYNAGPTAIDANQDVLGPISMRYVANVEEGSHEVPPAIADYAAAQGAAAVALSARLEAELAELTPEEAAAMRAELGLDESGLEAVVRGAERGTRQVLR